MSTAELQRGQLPISRRKFAFASLFLLTALAPLINGHTTHFVLPALVLTLLIDAWARDRLVLAVPELHFATASVGAFLGYAAVSALWAMEPANTLVRVAAAGMIALGSVAAVMLLRREQSSNLWPMAAGLLIGFLIGLLLCLFELLTTHRIKLWVVETLHVPRSMWRRLQDTAAATDSRDHFGLLNRSMATVTLLLWPALMIVAGLVIRRWRIAAAMLLIALTLTVVMLSAHMTSKVAILVGLIGFAVSWHARRLAFCTFAAAWIVSCLAIVPAARLPYHLGLHDAPWLKHSAQHRVIIWNRTAEQVLKAPYFGRGANMSPVLAPIIDRTLPPERLMPSLATHPHNVFLQTWFELGLVGALLLTTAGLAILSRVRLLTPQQQPFAYAMLACAGASLHASFGMWQIWYLCLYGLAMVWFALGQRALEWSSEGQEDTAQPPRAIVP